MFMIRIFMIIRLVIIELRRETFPKNWQVMFLPTNRFIFFRLLVSGLMFVFSKSSMASGGILICQTRKNNLLGFRLRSQ